MPVSILMVVDLPAPFGPMKATDCPAGIARLMRFTASTFSIMRLRPCRLATVKVLDRFSNSTLLCIGNFLRIGERHCTRRIGTAPDSINSTAAISPHPPTPHHFVERGRRDAIASRTPLAHLVGEGVGGEDCSINPRRRLAMKLLTFLQETLHDIPGRDSVLPRGSRGSDGGRG